MEQGSTYFSQLTAAGREVIHGDYRAAARIFDLTREGKCPPEVGELAEMLGLMVVKIEAREHGLERALTDVRKKNAELEKASELRAEFGMFLSGTIILLSLYAMTLSFLQNVLKLRLGPVGLYSQLMNLGLFLLLTAMMVTFLRSHYHHPSTFGLTLRNWKRAIAESLLACIPALGALVLFKWYLVRHDPTYAAQPVIEWGRWEAWEFFALYVFVTFFQELSCRGFQQTCIERLLTSKRKTQVAVLLSAAQFGVVHLHYSFRVGLISFVGAALFGFLYARHRTIVGITIAHYILGQIIFGPLQLIY